MAIERERGISVVTRVMTFEHAGCVFNLLDTPGHEDFSEDTYRTLTAVDAAVMVIDAAKGIESRTRKLFEICRLRDIPIFTFVNKMDRESQDRFALLDEVASTLALDAAPVTWPVGRAADFVGTYDLRRRRYAADPGAAASPTRGWPRSARSWNWCARRCPHSRCGAFMEGHLTPVYFGGAHQGDRRRRPAGRAGGIRPPAARPGRRPARGGGDRAEAHRAGVQDPGQHGPQPPRPHRLRPHLLGAAGARACG